MVTILNYFIILLITFSIIIIYKYNNNNKIEFNNLTKRSNNIIKFPKNIYDLQKIISFANSNKYKITIIGGGHSSYFMRSFPKFYTDKLIIICMKNFKGIKYLKNKKRYLLNAGVNAGEIKRFNKKNRKYYCLHGDCNKVGLGFFVNGGGNFSGINFGTRITGFASDYIKKINYVNANGIYKSLDNVEDDEFKSLKILGGEFGIITSIEVELIKKPIPVFYWLSINCEEKNIYELIEYIFTSKELNNNDINMELAIPSFEKKLIIIFWYVPLKSTKRVFNKIIKNLNVNFKINKLETFVINLKNIINNYDLSSGYKNMFDNKWSASCNVIPYNHSNLEIIKELINITNKNNYMSILWLTRFDFQDKKYIYTEFNSSNIFDKNIEFIEKLTNVKDRKKYLNIPSPTTDIKEYFTENSVLSYNRVLEMKKKLDPNNIFTTRNPLL
ncbi:hypothetical protein CPAV1605_712 [seawater metagenome]|uniref:FAD-binding PCMH-type domain-containing protein n=1 Tax=seawater metagenome TaxID=1561972 RepID=A0A5E8CIS0_9ZZZZ